jgi:hypothetical protein
LIAGPDNELRTPLGSADFGRIAGKEDVNWADASGWILGGNAAYGCAALPSQMGRAAKIVGVDLFSSGCGTNNAFAVATRSCVSM